MQLQSHRSPSAVVLLAVIALLSGCGGADEVTPRLPTADEASANVILWVSNQSFDDESVRITVRLDDRAVIDQDFDVEGQHNWISFPLVVGSGSHKLAVTSDSGAQRVDQLIIPKTGRRYAVVDYWREGRELPHFEFQASDTPIGFD
ncbi:MAG TPA: hypothetical protein VLL08_19255 [Kineosporiaceae bacterium]|nr:hypothetical protein [Kineosporiaceae bacterium]